MVLGYACSKYTTGLLSQPETLQLVDCFFRLLCKKERNVKHVVLKVIPLTTPALAFLKEKKAEHLSFPDFAALEGHLARQSAPAAAAAAIAFGLFSSSSAEEEEENFLLSFGS